MDFLALPSVLAASPWTKVLWIGLMILGTTVLTIAVAVIVIVRLPKNYFTRSPETDRKKPLPKKILKNAVGALLIVVGIVLSLPGIPGPGFLLAFLGLGFTDFPGKMKLQKKLIRRKRVNGMLNWIRGRFGKPHFLMPA